MWPFSPDTSFHFHCFVEARSGTANSTCVYYMSTLHFFLFLTVLTPFLWTKALYIIFFITNCALECRSLPVKLLGILGPTLSSLPAPSVSSAYGLACVVALSILAVLSQLPMFSKGPKFLADRRLWPCWRVIWAPTDHERINVLNFIVLCLYQFANTVTLNLSRTKWMNLSPRDESQQRFGPVVYCTWRRLLFAVELRTQAAGIWRLVSWCERWSLHCGNDC